MRDERYEWDDVKAQANRVRHGVSFETARMAFVDTRRVIRADMTHSAHERRYFCFGMAAGGVLTVRFTLREHRIRIIGAAYWRKGRGIYETANNI